MITMRVHCLPRGQGRPRTAVICGSARIYEAADDRDAKAEVRLLAERYRPPVPLDGPLGVDVVAIFRRTTHLARRAKKTGLLLESAARLWMSSKPDADNVGKLVLDALATFWADDARICDLRIRKVYAADGESPGYEIRIWRIGETT